VRWLNRNGILPAVALIVALAARAWGDGPVLRDRTDTPFLPSSPWNTQISPGRTFAPRASPISNALQQGDARINAGTWSHPIFYARSEDPQVLILDLENRRYVRFRVPKAATPDPKPDAHMYVVSDTRRQVLELIGTKRAGDRISAHRAVLTDLYGLGMFIKDGSQFPGVRASDASGYGGLIRSWEIKRASINHALTFALPARSLKHGPVWPFRKEDYWGFKQYKGDVPIGTLIAIPHDVDISAMGLSRAGYALARALQNYGAYCSDQAGTAGIVIYAEGNAEDLPQTQDLRNDFTIIRRLLLPVTNNGPYKASNSITSSDKTVIKAAPPLVYKWSVVS
jgi:hypothetical protein